MNKILDLNTDTITEITLTEEEQAALDAKEAAWAAGADDRAAAEVRAERDAKLADTDWTASTDVTMTAEMTAYRQALRDVPAQAGFPNTITWPTEPEV
tara:strand:+ start:396 stop:689 length:294 start_codon:yes stop_codon:yes gene_type:complete